MRWQMLVLSLPTDGATVRMRAWRALKAAGAAVLRDGVYLLPDAPRHAAVLAEVAADVRGGGGGAHCLVTEHDGFEALFDRHHDYRALLAELTECRAAAGRELSAIDARQLRRLRKTFEQLSAIDFFPGESQRQAAAALAELEADVAQATAPDEPHHVQRRIARLDAARYRGKLWATRRRPWVDRLASAWLIRRFIDPEARFVWLKSPADCPKRAIGFDFDGATFTHVGAYVTFETLMASFGLDTPALRRLALLVHGLDAGGVLPDEAPGVERVLAGMREAITKDDQLLAVAAGVFEALHAAYELEVPA